jgi:hypothetical protein
MIFNLFDVDLTHDARRMYSVPNVIVRITNDERWIVRN